MQVEKSKNKEPNKVKNKIKMQMVTGAITDATLSSTRKYGRITDKMADGGMISIFEEDLSVNTSLITALFHDLEDQEDLVYLQIETIKDNSDLRIPVVGLQRAKNALNKLVTAKVGDLVEFYQNDSKKAHIKKTDDILTISIFDMIGMNG